jgi:outer membrane protein
MWRIPAPRKRRVFESSDVSLRRTVRRLRRPMQIRRLATSLRSNRSRALTAVVALILAMVAPRVYAQVRIGVVDVRRAVAETAEGRAAFDALKVRYDDRQRDLDRRTKAIEALKRRVEHPAAPIPQARLAKMAEDYQRQVMELQQYGQQYTAELQSIEGELTKNILSKMQPIVRQIGQTDNYQLIVDEQAVHFAPTHLNLTDRVIQQYNQQYPVRGPITLPNPAPPPQQGSGGALSPTGPEPTNATPDAGAPSSASGGDAGRGLSPVFFRRDAGR